MSESDCPMKNLRKSLAFNALKANPISSKYDRMSRNRNMLPLAIFAQKAHQMKNFCYFYRVEIVA